MNNNPALPEHVCILVLVAMTTHLIGGQGECLIFCGSFSYSNVVQDDIGNIVG